MQNCLSKIKVTAQVINNKTVIEEDVLLHIMLDYDLSPSLQDKIYNELTNNNIMIVNNYDEFAKVDEQAKFVNELAYTLCTTAIELMAQFSSVDATNETKDIVRQAINQINKIFGTASIASSSNIAKPIHHSTASTSIRKQITPAMTAACYQKAKSIYTNNTSSTAAAGANQVSNQTGMAQGSAFMYISSTINMLKGIKYTRSMSLTDTKATLKNISRLW